MSFADFPVWPCWDLISARAKDLLAKPSWLLLMTHEFHVAYTAAFFGGLVMHTLPALLVVLAAAARYQYTVRRSRWAELAREKMHWSLYAVCQKVYLILMMNLVLVLMLFTQDTVYCIMAEICEKKDDLEDLWQTDVSVCLTGPTQRAVGTLYLVAGLAILILLWPILIAALKKKCAQHRQVRFPWLAALNPFGNQQIVANNVNDVPAEDDEIQVAQGIGEPIQEEQMVLPQQQDMIIPEGQDMMMLGGEEEVNLEVYDDMYVPRAANGIYAIYLIDAPEE